MADTNISAKIEGGVVQNTGNPVFDATVNMVINLHYVPNSEVINGIHGCLLEIYAKEPKRANPPTVKSIVQMQREAQEADARSR